MVRVSAARIPPLEPEEFSDELRERFDSGPDTLNIFRTLANHPDLLKRWTVFANHILMKSTLDSRTRELVILRVAWLCRSGYEWGQHVAIAQNIGMSIEDIQRVQEGSNAPGWDSRDRLVLEAVDELHEDAHVGDQTWNSLSAMFSVQEMMDLVFTAGQYTLLAMALNSFGVQLETGSPGFD